MINYNRANDLFNVNQTFNSIKDLLTKESATNKDPLINGMIKNLIGDGTNEGQIKMAVLNKEYYNKWGEFYLDQLSRSLNQEMKPNFKDEACLFGGEIFDDIVDASSEIFNNLPPPTPSNINQTRSSSNGITYRSAPIDLSAYNDPNGGCYTGDSLITLANKTQKRVDEIQKGDKVLSISHPFDPNAVATVANVLCVVKTVYENDIKLISIDGGPKITPWHPVYFYDTWCFPNSLPHNKVNLNTSKEVYTLVLDNYHVVFVDNIPCICLGHNYVDNAVLYHNYFGSSKVITDLKKLNGWENGNVVIDPNSYTRDPHTNLINGMM